MTDGNERDERGKEVVTGGSYHSLIRPSLSLSFPFRSFHSPLTSVLRPSVRVS